MFYCDLCADKFGYPVTIGRSYGRCECCEKTAECSDMPSSKLPRPKTAPLTEAQVINDEH